MRDARRSKRQHPYYSLAVLDRKTRKEVGRLGDITKEGMLLISEERFTPQALLELEVVLPEVPGSKLDTLPVTARVKWTGLDNQPPGRCTGLEFVNPGPNELANIEYIANLVGFTDP